MKFISTNYRWITLRDHFLVWTIAFVLFACIRNIGTRELNGFEIPPTLSMIMSLSLGFIFGTISGIATLYFSERFYRRVSLRKFFFARIAFTVAFILSVFLLVYSIYNLLLEDFDVTFMFFISQPVIWVVVVYLLIVDFGLALFHQVNLMLGRGNLKKLIRGQFYEPKEENRVFMFLDLQSSTTIAEQIGHLKFSRLIQDCFNDLAVVENYDAQVYQYVGDEAVLTWSTGCLENGKCLKAYFAFMNLLVQKKPYYLEAYGVHPFFKAGLHIGQVTVSEVGKYKREIAYHGDTLNTAARIQALCNELQSGLLISDDLKQGFGGETGLIFTAKGPHELKGKAQPMELWSVTQPQ